MPRAGDAVLKLVIWHLKLEKDAYTQLVYLRAWYMDPLRGCRLVHTVSQAFTIPGPRHISLLMWMLTKEGSGGCLTAKATESGHMMQISTGSGT